MLCVGIVARSLEALGLRLRLEEGVALLAPAFLEGGLSVGWLERDKNESARGDGGRGLLFGCALGSLG